MKAINHSAGLLQNILTCVQRKITRLIRQQKPFNRRKYVRYIISPPIECVCIYMGSGQRVEYSSSILDVSKAGLLVATYGKKIYPRTEVEIRFQLPNRRETISIYGRTMRVSRRQDKILYYSGVKFQNEEEEGIQLLLDFALGKSLQSEGAV